MRCVCVHPCVRACVCVFDLHRRAGPRQHAIRGIKACSVQPCIIGSRVPATVEVISNYV